VHCLTRIVGSEHEDTLHYKVNLSYIHRMQENDQGAIELCEEVLKTARSKFGENHEINENIEQQTREKFPAQNAMDPRRCRDSSVNFMLFESLLRNRAIIPRARPKKSRSIF